MDEVNRLIYQATCHAYLDYYEEAKQVLEEAYEIALEVVKSKQSPQLAFLYLKMIKVYDTLGDDKHRVYYLEQISKCDIEQQPEVNAELVQYITSCEVSGKQLGPEDELKQLLAAYSVFKSKKVVSVQGVNLGFHLFLAAVKNQDIEAASNGVELIHEMMEKVKLPDETQLEKDAKLAVQAFFEKILEQVECVKNEHESMFENSFEDIGEI